MVMRNMTENLSGLPAFRLRFELRILQTIRQAQYPLHNECHSFLNSMTKMFI
jgi:hypothetical protein